MLYIKIGFFKEHWDMYMFLLLISIFLVIIRYSFLTCSQDSLQSFYAI